MTAAKWVTRIFMVLLAMLTAWIFYSILLEYPYSTVLSLGSNFHSESTDMNDTTMIVNKTIDQYDGTRRKAALWAAADGLQVPFGSYYYFYSFLPNLRADEGVNAELAHAIGITEDKYQYRILLSKERENTEGANQTAQRQNLMGYIPMELSFDDDDTTFMTYPTDTETNGKFYTTGWY